MPYKDPIVRAAKQREAAARYKAAHPERPVEACGRYRENHPGLLAARARAARADNPQRVEACVLRWRLAHPEAYRAKFTVATAKQRGKIIAKPCEVCGERRVHAHHPDYSQPLKVVWLCALHHKAIHREKSA